MTETQTQSPGFFHALSTPIRHFSLRGQSASPNRDKTAPPTPDAWVCHHCVYLVSVEAARTGFGDNHCHGCAHERCGQCEVIYRNPAADMEPEFALDSDTN